MKQPRFYQTEAKEAVIHRIRENSKKGVASRILVDAAAGAGKTIMMAIIAQHVHGRITAAFKSQPGFTATVTDQQIAANLLANGYSFYGAYSTSNDNFNFLYNGKLNLS